MTGHLSSEFRWKDLRLVRAKKRERQNRAYYPKYNEIKDLKVAGVLQDPAKTSLDLVQVEPKHERNELLYFFGVQPEDGSHFELKLTIASLLEEHLLQSDDATRRTKPARWRLATVALVVQLKSGLRLTYNHEQLVDYDRKRNAGARHEHRNIYRVGALSVETVLPFSLARILLNGIVRVDQIDPSTPVSSAQYRPVRLAVSTHPTCDKFDYTYRFGSEYTAKLLSRSRSGASQEDDNSRLLNLVLEDRFDQPLMFQGWLQSLDDESLDVQFVMWGTKVKKFLDAERELSAGASTERDPQRECLFMWSECGHQINLSRPVSELNLIYGMVNNCFDYASYLYEACLENSTKEAIKFRDLNSFCQLTSGHIIKLRAFKKKYYSISFKEDLKSSAPLHRISINGFDGWALRTILDLGDCIEQAQHKLISSAIHDRMFSVKLNEEGLLGGKGSSLIGLSERLTSNRLQPDRLSQAVGCEVSVPRGLIVTSQAYALWLKSDPSILEHINSLDATRRFYASKSATCLNSASEQYISPLKGRQLLDEACDSTRDKLLGFPLPDALRGQLQDNLLEIFGVDAFQGNSLDDTNLKAFAVRSSAVGEDSLETSAAGQMRTILNARGLNAICRAVVECWASQFELEAITYKSQNGLQINLPMAVVIQEQVACEVAGVAATCDPLTGNWARLEIAANPGMGEGVVAGGRADTVRVSLAHLSWQPKSARFLDRLALGQAGLQIEKLGAPGHAGCCLTDAQIVALANLLLEIRHTSELQEREVEWGITTISEDDSGSSSSSSSNDGRALTNARPNFRIHLFQSRPLTNLRRLSTFELDHELDHGAPSPNDLSSRANLGEVMPGAMCALNQSWFTPVVCSFLSMRPDLDKWSRNHYSMAWFGFYAHMATSIQTNCMTIRHFYCDDLERRELQHAINYTMVGNTFEPPKGEAELKRFEQFLDEREHPMLKTVEIGASLAIALDTGVCQLLEKTTRRSMNRTKLNEDLSKLEELASSIQTTNCGLEIERVVYSEIGQLFERLTRRLEPLGGAWKLHMLASVTSVAFNMMSLKMISEQPAHKGKPLTDNELLDDFCVLVRDPSSSSKKLHDQTESGDISKLLDELLVCLIITRQLDSVKQLKPDELCKFFTSPDNSRLECTKIFAKFMARNGHRAWKEFCLATKTWGDDPSYIMRLLAARLKSYTETSYDKTARVEGKTGDNLDTNGQKNHETRLAEAMARLSNEKFLLTNYLLPRARNATIRRECSKSLLIKTIHKYRLAFRHLAGLMCLAGLLPNAELIFYLTIEEIDEIVRKCCALERAQRQPRETVMPRLLFKARRRQQRSRLFDRVTFPRPTISVREMIDTIRAQTGERARAAPSGQQQAARGAQAGPGGEVRGITSCAGRVTGRACVLGSLDDVDQLEPGDILVTYSIDISWSVYFFMLAGIVTEVGGIVSHGAVVAREYGLPTLCTAVGACSRFETGQTLVLDASRGVCHLAGSEPELEERD